MRGRPKALEGIRKEMIEFMRSCESLLSLASSETLTDDETEIVRYYIEWLNEKCRCETSSPLSSSDRPPSS
jgi:hypothetical protein